MHYFHVGLNHFLFVSVLLFGLGLYAIVTRKNVVMILIGIELILSAANLNFISFQRFSPVSSDGQAISIFIVILAIAQTVTIAGIIMNFYRHFQTINPEKVNKLKE